MSEPPVVLASHRLCMLRGLPVQIEVEASDEELIPDAGEGARAEAGPAEEAVVAEGQLEAPGEEPMEAEDLHVPLGDREYQDHVLRGHQSYLPSCSLCASRGVIPARRRQDPQIPQSSFVSDFVFFTKGSGFGV